MITLWRNFWHALLWDEAAAKRWLMGLVGFLVSVAGQIAILGVDTILAWSRRELWSHVALALISALLTMVPTPKTASPLPAPPPSPPEIK